jgi:hypothetical protein
VGVGVANAVPGTLGVGACGVRDLRIRASTGCVPRGTAMRAKCEYWLCPTQDGQYHVMRAKCEYWLCPTRGMVSIMRGVHRTANGSAGYSRIQFL